MRRTVLWTAAMLALVCVACRGDFESGGGGSNGGGSDGSDGSGGSSADDGSGTSSSSGGDDGSATGDTSDDGGSTGATGSTTDDCGGADFDNDPENCGYCGHSCVGGECVEGVCQPVPLAEDWARDIAVGSDRVFWHNNTAEAILIFSVSIDGGESDQVAERLTGSGIFAGLHLDSEFVYTTHGASTEGKVFKAPLGGGTLSTVGGGTDPRQVRAVAFDETHAYWVDLGNEPATLREVPLAGGVATPLVADMPTTPTGLAVDATALYWVAPETTTNAGDGTVMRLAKQGGTPEPLVAEEVYGPQDVVTDGTSVYWTDYGSHKVRKVSTTGGSVDDLALGQLPGSLAVDDVAVYWVDGYRKIQCVALDGGTVTTLAEDVPTAPEVIALDDQAVYWSSSNPDPAAAIWKVAKP